MTSPTRRVVYLVASSVDGFIARPDGGLDGFCMDLQYLRELFDRFPETCPAPLRREFGVEGRENRRFDTVLMGRATYQPGIDAGVTDPYPTLETIVVSSSLPSTDPRVRVTAEALPELVGGLRSRPGLDIWLCGGGRLAGSLLTAGLVDELVLKVNPVVLGAGIPLFGGHDPGCPLTLLESEDLPAGVRMLRYRVES